MAGDVVGVLKEAKFALFCSDMNIKDRADQSIRLLLAELEAGHAGGGVVDVEALTYRVANAKLGEGPSVRCEGPTDFEKDQARAWVKRVLAALAPSPSAGEPVRLNCNHCSARFNTEWERVEHERESHATPPATPVLPTASVEAVAPDADLIRAGIHGIIHDHAETIGPQRVHWLNRAIASLIPAPTQGEAEIQRIAMRLAELHPSEGLLFEGGDYEIELRWLKDEPTPSPAPVSAPAPAGGLREALESAARRIEAEKSKYLPGGPFDVKRLLDYLATEVRALSNPAPGHGEAVPVAARSEPAAEMVEALRECRDYIASPVRMSRDEDEQARRAAIVERATRALTAPTPAPAPAPSGEALHGPFGHLVIPTDLDEEHWRIEDEPVNEPGYASLALFTKVDPFAHPATGEKPAPAAGKEAPCDCERGHNGIGLAGRECDCRPATPKPEDQSHG